MGVIASDTYADRAIAGTLTGRFDDKRNQQMFYIEENLLPSSARAATAGTNTATISGYGRVRQVILQNTVTAATAITNYVVKLQHSLDGVNWADVTGGTFPNRTAAGADYLVVTSAIADRVRLNYVITGTSITSKVDWAIEGF